MPTLVSRCQRIPFYRLSLEQMKQLLKNQGQEEVLSHPELLAISQGSPGKAIAALAQLNAIPEALRQQVIHFPKSPLKALELAKLLDQELDTQTQLWLIDYLQYSYWHKHHKKAILEALEKARQCLLTYVQPRLVWECTLLEIIKSR